MNFKNILLTVLTLGTIAVCVLMVLVYLELSATPEQTAQRYQEQQQVDTLFPSNKLTANNDIVVTRAPTLATYDNHTETDSQEKETMQNDVKVNGNTEKEKKNNKKNNATDDIQHNDSVQKNTIVGERELVPINTKQPNTMANNNIGEKKERVLKPIENKKANQTQAIDELF
ncbi:MAG: hypothetical protein IJR46_00095 [Neisseriaceae bacterium]|nr:hypothetical protein [Neisseriaceae bacterium]